MKIPKQQTVGWIKISSQVSSLSRILIFYRLSKYALDLSCITANKTNIEKLRSID